MGQTQRLVVKMAAVREQGRRFCETDPLLRLRLVPSCLQMYLVVNYQHVT